MGRFKVGDIVIYRNGNSYELGEIKRVLGDGTYFVYYHMGETGALTKTRDLHRIKNAYAFDIRRKKA